MITKTLYIPDKVYDRDKVAIENHRRRVREWLKYAMPGEELAIRNNVSIWVLDNKGVQMRGGRMPLPDMPDCDDDV